MSNPDSTSTNDTDMVDTTTLKPTKENAMHSPPMIKEKPPVQLVKDDLPAKLSCLQLKRTIEEAVKIEFNNLFGWSSSGNGFTMVNRRAMLLYHPEDHSEELEVITRWLLMHHVEVSSAWYSGSWDYFRQQILKGGSGIIMVSLCSVICF
jgi:chromo domain-containing protein 1